MQQHSSYLCEILSACFKSLKQWLLRPSLFYLVVSVIDTSRYFSWFRKKCLLCLNHILKLSCCKICEVFRRPEIMLNMLSLVWPKRLQIHYITLKIWTVEAGERKLQTNFCWAGNQIFVSKPLQSISEKPFLSQYIGVSINFCCCSKMFCACRFDMATRTVHFMIMNFSCHFSVVFQNVFPSSCNAVVKTLSTTANVLLVHHCYGFRRMPVHKELKRQSELQSKSMLSATFV